MHLRLDATLMVYGSDCCKHKAQILHATIFADINIDLKCAIPTKG